MILAWMYLAGILFVTLAPIGLRPHDPLPVNLDRAFAFCIMSGLFVAAYPRHWLAILLFSLTGAGLIEGLQLLSPSRHARLADALVKAGGAVTGVIIGMLFNRATWRSHSGRSLIIDSLAPEEENDDDAR